MVATRRSKRVTSHKKEVSTRIGSPKSKPEDDSSDSDSDIDLEALVSQTCEKMRSSLPSNSTNETQQVQGMELGFVIDKRPVRDNEHVSTMDTNQFESESESESNIESEDDEEQTNVKGSSQSKQKMQKNKSLELASSLQTNYQTSSLYVNVDSYRDPAAQRKNHKHLLQAQDKEIMKKSVLKSDLEKQHNILPYEESLNQLRIQHKKERESTKGKNWNHMAATELTEERKNDLMVLKMRRVLDPKRFYKSNDIKGLPKYFEFGKIEDSPLEFYTSRIPKKQRKSNMVEELLADAQFRNYNKKKYTEIQEASRKSKGAFKHMKRLKKKKR